MREKLRWTLRRSWRDEHGAILVFVAVATIGILGMAGLALDSARLYVARAELSRAVDAAALRGASSIRLGEAVASSRIETFALANGVDAMQTGVTLGYAFGTNAEGETTVSVSATRPVLLTFMRVLGHTQVGAHRESVRELGNQLVRLLLARSVVHGDAKALGGERATARGADPRATAGDECRRGGGHRSSVPPCACAERAG